MLAAVRCIAPRPRLVSRISSLGVALMSTSASTVSVARPEKPSFDVPAFYKTSPPPHHQGADPTKAGFKSPWASAGSHSALTFIRGRLFDWNEVPLPSRDKLPTVRKATYAPESAGASSAEGTDGKIHLTWLGHAGAHLRLPVSSGSSFTVVTDPVLSRRCSPFQFFGPARFTEACTSVADMASSSVSGAWPDVLVLSHNHYDHLDLNTIKAFLDTPGKPVPHVMCTTGNKSWFLSLGMSEEQVTELDWWEERIVTRASDGERVRFTCVPAQHFSGRSANDRDKTLWAGWTMETLPKQGVDAKGVKVYFAGDSGYGDTKRGMTREEELKRPVCPAFKEIGDLLGPFDLSLIPIGAYLPRWVMSNIHADPFDAVRIHQDVRSKKTYGIHHGVFRLTPEDVNEPVRLLEEAKQQFGVPQQEFITCDIGETVVV